MLGLLPNSQDYKKSIPLYTLFFFFFVYVCKCFSTADPWKENRWAVIKVFHFVFATGIPLFSLLSHYVLPAIGTETKNFPEIVKSVES